MPDIQSDLQLSFQRDGLVFEVDLPACDAESIFFDWYGPGCTGRMRLNREYLAAGMVDYRDLLAGMAKSQIKDRLPPMV